MHFGIEMHSGIGIDATMTTVGAAFVSAPGLAPSTGCLRSRRRPPQSPRRQRRPLTCSSATPTSTVEHERYLRDVAKVSPPSGLSALLHVLSTSGETFLGPSQRRGLHPFLVPVSRAPSGAVTGLLRWPTMPDSMEMPLARATPDALGLTLLAPSALAHVRRVHAAADYAGRTDAAAAIRRFVPKDACKAGEVEASGAGTLERFLVMKVAAFPDVYRGLAEFHAAKGDTESALVTCERANVLFPGWAGPHVFYARVLSKAGRDMEARDAARFALQMPLWTMGSLDELKEMGRLAGYVDDSSLEKIYQRLFEDRRENEVQEGKKPEQVALDRAAYYLDWAMTRGETSWDDVDLERLAELYDEAGMGDIATFVRY